jgi:hypothetical protein
MEIIGSDSSNIQASQAAALTARPSGPALSNSSDGKTPAASSRVSISGTALMLSRLFGTHDLAAEPPVEMKSDRDGLAKSPLLFLTKDDRALLAQMYDYAQQQGADLKHVDSLAFDLGMYRQYGKLMVNLNNGTMFDIEGHAQTFSFSDKDAATAARILNSDSMNSTKLDRGFLTYITDPGYGVYHVGNFDFMEQMVNKFSNTGGTAESLDSKFSTFDNSERDRRVVHTSDKVTLVIPEPDYISVNGVGHWRTPELAAAHARDTDAGAAPLNVLLENFGKPQGFLVRLLELWDKFGNSNRRG